MMDKPSYFDAVRLDAARRWDQLEQDPELAGPWHLLFKQVQSPRHVISELLQNADDAFATEASVRIEDHTFVFEHDGEDFSAEQFRSLCRFGYSNKRTLHTIGFRGIGFKSTFSLGERVELFTPTLAVSFDRRRFTEPCWHVNDHKPDELTCVRVAMANSPAEQEIARNLEEWLGSSISLLFFSNLRRLIFDNRTVHWVNRGLGPVPESEWLVLNGHEQDEYLLVRSKAEPFPEEALAEIRQERMLGDDELFEFPPCSIEIVLGAKGRLYVVLPTGVETDLPFACNAPFIQDPARMKIKDPESSPTNRWLLERAGILAAETMLGWLKDSNLSVEERASAYRLFPTKSWDKSSLDGACRSIVVQAFKERIDGEPFLLTQSGGLTPANKCVSIAAEIAEIWSPGQAAKLLDERPRPALCQHIEPDNRKKLLSWGVVSEIDKQKLLSALGDKHLPKPKSWRQLLNLWVYIAPEITPRWSDVRATDVRIVPVQGKEVLYAASEIVRLGEKKLLQSEEDWEFLAEFLIVLNQNWPRFLAKERRLADEQDDTAAGQAIDTAFTILKRMALEDASAVDNVVNQVAAAFFAQQTITIQNCARLAQIAAKLGAKAGEAFRFISRDKYRRRIAEQILYDADGTLEDLLPSDFRETRLLHDEYLTDYSSCTQDEWNRWVASGRAGLFSFPPFRQRVTAISGRARLEQVARERGHRRAINYQYVTNSFDIEDWDFDEKYWRHWENLAASNERIWSTVVDFILRQREEYWNQAKSARLLQTATTGNKRPITFEPLTPAWAMRLRNLPCLPDTRGSIHKPSDLLRRTLQTEPLLGLEPFIDHRLDTEKLRPLLDLLGVQCTPTGPDRILTCLRALAQSDSPPVGEVEKWYRRLDQLIASGSFKDVQTVRDAFRSEKLILAADGSWATADAVFMTSDESDVPGTAIIRSSVSDLTLWRRIGLAERPTADIAVRWLKSLKSGASLPSDDVQRVRALLRRYPVPIWEECAHWLSLAGEWVPLEELSYALTMQRLTPWQHLHAWVKQKTADFQYLGREVSSGQPFARLEALADQIDERIDHNPSLIEQSGKKEWLAHFGMELRRIELNTEEETQRVRALAERLSRTNWQVVQRLECMPYIDGTPAGTSRRVDVVWLDEALYVEPLPKAKLARRVPEEIGKVISNSEIKAALDYSFERYPDDIREYMEANFKLAAPSDLPDFDGNADGCESPEASPTEEMATQKSTSNGTGDDVAANQQTRPGHEESSDDQSPDSVDSTSKDDEEVPDRGDQSAEHRHREQKPVRPGIIERFAVAHGYRKDSEERYFNGDGSWLGRVKESIFPWEKRDASGDLVLSYLPVDHCLERSPLQLDVEAWTLLERHPESYALVLSDLAGDAIEIIGTQLIAMRKSKEVELLPSTYRLVYNHD